jgi:hypothetical protein
MEGSIHEKAVLVSLAYFIGGLTMFIAFGINTSPALVDTAAMTAAVYSTQANHSAIEPPVFTSADSRRDNSAVAYRDGMLEVETVDGVQILSFNPEITGMPITADFEKQGHHFNEPVWAVSSSGQYVYFCEQQSVESRSCSSFVYDALRQVIQAVTLAGASSPVPVEMAQSAYFDGDSLIIGNLRSAEPTAPWELTYR